MAYSPIPFPMARKRPHPTADIVVSALVLCLQLALTMLIVIWSPMWVMATDSCGPDCPTGYLTAGYAVAYGGMAVALGVAVGGMALCYVRRLPLMWLCPVLGTAITLGTTTVGVNLAERLMNY
ncbi:hypothetical protein LV457_16135 [Mycobacterium sp. MYCO198283]|uniref:hypothetical protein n=1 Tax=Mycobacterium sp. MYCO198283 TaxID=2883505 RepID=UPI001E62F620|nr:hypothetical protein [Mycobacterium sp. MYCO198283]MCG5433805.1 hypothetical protein [Mycobacterium sp. MYCO198283]